MVSSLTDVSLRWYCTGDPLSCLSSLDSCPVGRCLLSHGLGLSLLDRDTPNTPSLAQAPGRQPLWPMPPSTEDSLDARDPVYQASLFIFLHSAGSGIIWLGFPKHNFADLNVPCRLLLLCLCPCCSLHLDYPCLSSAC